jgi:hypothetical protein
VTDGEALASIMRRSSGAFVVVDEAGTILGRQASTLEAAILTARHRGHTVAICAQRTALVSRTARDQCGRLFAFRLGFEDARDLVRQYGHPGLAACATLQRGCFLSCTPFEAPREYRLW